MFRKALKRPDSKLNHMRLQHINRILNSDAENDDANWVPFSVSYSTYIMELKLMIPLTVADEKCSTGLILRTSLYSSNSKHRFDPLVLISECY